MLRVLVIAAAGLAATIALRKIAVALKPQPVKAPPRQDDARAVTKLRRDPETGVYYPEQ